MLSLGNGTIPSRLVNAVEKFAITCPQTITAFQSCCELNITYLSCAHLMVHPNQIFRSRQLNVSLYSANFVVCNQGTVSPVAAAAPNGRNRGCEFLSDAASL